MPCYSRRTKPMTVGQVYQQALDAGVAHPDGRGMLPPDPNGPPGRRPDDPALEGGAVEFHCSRESKAPHCHACWWVGDLLCDWPVGGGKTCDLPMCEDHAHDLGDDRHLCEIHFRMFHAAGADKVNVWPPKASNVKKGGKKK